jgi:hypothetical protein
LIVFYIVLGIIVAFILAVLLPWALLRKLDPKDQGDADS